MSVAAAPLVAEARVGWRQRSFWWARRHPEPPLPPDVCAKDGTTGTGPFDLYCSDGEEHFILFSRSSLLHHGILYSFRVALGALALASASFKTAAPMYAAAGLIGFALLAFPLRAFRTSRYVTVALWATALTLAAADYENAISAATVRAIVSAALALVIVALIAAVALHPFSSEDEDAPSEIAVRSVASGLVVGLAFVLAEMLGSTSLGRHFVHVVPSLRHAALLAGLTILTGTVVVAAAFGFLRGVHVADRDVELLIKGEPKLRLIVLARPPAPVRPKFHHGDFVARLAFAANAAAVALARRFIDAINGTFRAVARAALLLKRIARNVVNALHHLAVLAMRALTQALIATWRVIATALASVIRPLRHATRSLALTAALLGLAAGLTVYAAHHFSVYLISGGVGNGLLGLVVASAVVLLLVAVWWAATGWPAAEVLPAGGRLLERAGPTAYITALALAWADGIVGWAGVGPITPGWLTGAATALLTAVVVTTTVRTPGRFNFRRQIEEESD